MHSKDFFPARRAELKKFFELSFGYGWWRKLKRQTGSVLNAQPSHIIQAEKLARLHGFISRDENPRAIPLERNFLSRLRSVSTSVEKVPESICQPVTFKHVLEEFFVYRPHRSKHKRKHKDHYSDVIPIDLLVFYDLEQRTKYPSSGTISLGQAEDQSPFDSWLALPIGEPPGLAGLEGGKTRPPSSLSGSSETCIEHRVEDYEI